MSALAVAAAAATSKIDQRDIVFLRFPFFCLRATQSGELQLVENNTRLVWSTGTPRCKRANVTFTGRSLSCWKSRCFFIGARVGSFALVQVAATKFFKKNTTHHNTRRARGRQIMRRCFSTVGSRSLARLLMFFLKIQHTRVTRRSSSARAASWRCGIRRWHSARRSGPRPRPRPTA